MQSEAELRRHELRRQARAARRELSEGERLAAAQAQLSLERSALLAKNEQARTRVEAMISRLKALEQNG